MSFYRRQARARIEANRREVLKVEIFEGRLVVSIGVETLGFAACHSPFFDTPQFEKHQPRITDADAFAKEIAVTLEAEEENGTTLVHRMIDAAVGQAVDYGTAEGLEFHVPFPSD